MPETVWNGPPPYKTDPDSLEAIMRQRMYEQTPVPEGRTGRLAFNEAWRIFCRKKGEILDRPQWYKAMNKHLNIPAPKESMDALFDRYDKDRDGKISQAPAPAPTPRALFQSLSNCGLIVVGALES